MASSRETNTELQPTEISDLTTIILDFTTTPGLYAALRVNRLFKETGQSILEKRIGELRDLSAKTLCELGEKDEKTALMILQVPDLYNKLGAHNATQLFWINERSPTGMGDPTAVAMANGSFLARLGEAHIAAAKLLLENQDLCARLHYSTVEKLKNKLQPRTYFGTFRD